MKLLYVHIYLSPRFGQLELHLGGEVLMFMGRGDVPCHSKNCRVDGLITELNEGL
jgi:hypothetical protein